MAAVAIGGVIEGVGYEVGDGDAAFDVAFLLHLAEVLAVGDEKDAFACGDYVIACSGTGVGFFGFAYCFVKTKVGFEFLKWIHCFLFFDLFILLLRTPCDGFARARCFSLLSWVGAFR